MVHLSDPGEHVSGAWTCPAVSGSYVDESSQLVRLNGAEKIKTIITGCGVEASLYAYLLLWSSIYFFNLRLPPSSSLFSPRSLPTLPKNSPVCFFVSHSLTGFSPFSVSLLSSPLVCGWEATEAEWISSSCSRLLHVLRYDITSQMQHGGYYITHTHILQIYKVVFYITVRYKNIIVYSGAFLQVLNSI